MKYFINTPEYGEHYNIVVGPIDVPQFPIPLNTLGEEALRNIVRKSCLKENIKMHDFDGFAFYDRVEEKKTRVFGLRKII